MCCVHDCTYYATVTITMNMYILLFFYCCHNFLHHFLHTIFQCWFSDNKDFHPKVNFQKACVFPEEEKFGARRKLCGKIWRIIFLCWTGCVRACFYFRWDVGACDDMLCHLGGLDWVGSNYVCMYLEFERCSCWGTNASSRTNHEMATLCTTA